MEWKNTNLDINIAKMVYEQKQKNDNILTKIVCE